MPTSPTDGHGNVITGRFVADPDTITLGDDFNVLRPVKLANGATVLAYYPETGKSGIVLAHWRTSEFVTWRAYWTVDNEDGVARWECEVGHYYRGRESEHEAWQAFMQRAGIIPTTSEDE